MRSNLYDLIINTNLNLYTYYTLIRAIFTNQRQSCIIIYDKGSQCETRFHANKKGGWWPSFFWGYRTKSVAVNADGTS